MNSASNGADVCSVLVCLDHPDFNVHKQHQQQKVACLELSVDKYGDR